MSKEKNYVVNLFIPRTEKTKRLYAMEEKLAADLLLAAGEYSKTMNIPKEEYWTKAVPSEIYTLLDSIETGASVAAATAYLIRCGFVIFDNKGAKQGEQRLKQPKTQEP